MIKIGKSKCHCGFCEAVFDIEWEVETTYSYDHEHGMGEETEYECTAWAECPECGNEIIGHMNIYEYPVGALNMISEIQTDDGETVIEAPRVNFFDI